MEINSCHRLRIPSIDGKSIPGYKINMQAVHDIFAFWPTIAAFAQDLDLNPDAVRKWKKFGRIPQEAWGAVIEAAGKRGKTLTLADIVAANAPMKQRGRPSTRKIRAAGAEERAS